MIITRSPLRITLGGGGTDVPSYYREHGGFCVAAAIDKYVYITLHETFDPGITLKYSKMEHVKNVDEIEHPIFREVLRIAGIRDPHLEIASHADIPAGTGLGSSSSFTVALLKALFVYKEMNVPNAVIARYACEIEIDTLGEPIGKQDQYMAALGGLTALTFCSDGTVEHQMWPTTAAAYWQDEFLMFFTGYSRSASDVLSAQTNDNLGDIKNAGWLAYNALNDRTTGGMGKQFDYQWDLKLERNPNINPLIAQWRLEGKTYSWGSKLVGAGGGGFLLFHAADKQALRTAMFKAGLKEVRFSIDLEGTKVICE